MPVAHTHKLDLYCDNRSTTPVSYTPDYEGRRPNIELEDGLHWYAEFPVIIIRPTEKDAIKAAKLLGWIFKRDGRTFCPRCKNFTK